MCINKKGKYLCSFYFHLHSDLPEFRTNSEIWSYQLYILACTLVGFIVVDAKNGIGRSMSSS